MSEDHGCGATSEPGDVALASLALDPAMDSALDIMRCFFTAFASPASQGWIGAQEGSVAAYGLRDGPRMALALLRLVQALRGARRSPFRFSNPGCAHCRQVVTDTEARLIALIQEMRRGGGSALHVHAMMLCEGGDAAPLLIQARIAAELFDMMEAHKPTTAH